MQVIFLKSDERFLCKKWLFEAGDRNKDVDLTEAGSQIKQSLGLFSMLFHKLGETQLDIVPQTENELYNIIKKNRIYQTDKRTLHLITC